MLIKFLMIQVRRTPRRLPNTKATGTQLIAIAPLRHQFGARPHLYVASKDSLQRAK